MASIIVPALLLLIYFGDVASKSVLEKELTELENEFDDIINDLSHKNHEKPLEKMIIGEEKKDFKDHDVKMDDNVSAMYNKLVKTGKSVSAMYNNLGTTGKPVSAMYNNLGITGESVSAMYNNLGKTVDGKYGPWGQFNACSKSCGGGVQTKVRSCNKPSPQYGGKNCVGESSNSRQCNTHHCKTANPWILQQNNVCFGAKGDNFGTFQVNRDDPLSALKLVHISGYVSCDAPKYGTNWGCCKPVTRTKIGVVVTDDANNIVFPNGIPQDAAFLKGFYSMPGYNARSSTVQFDFSIPMYAVPQQKMRIWYLQDLVNYHDGNNNGVACVNVFAKFS